MPIAGTVQGAKYVPTPVELQTHRQTTFVDPRESSFLNNSTSPILQISPAPASSPSRKKTKSKTNTSKTKSTSAAWSRQKKIVVSIIVIAIILVIIIAAILLGVLLSKESASSSSTTTQDTSATVIYWSFDNTTNDLTNSYNSTLINNPSYFLQSTSQPFAGVGQGLNLVTASSQYVSVNSPFIDFTYKSFTIEFWIYPTAMTSSVDYGLIGQCQCSSCANQCFYLIIRSTRLYVSFMNNDLAGNQTFTTGTWYHVSFVYDYQNKQQTLYINGYQDVTKTSSNAYQGVNGTLMIGAARTFSATSYYSGYLDNVKITFRAKTATEILNAATLTAYYSFNLPNPTYDSGPLGLNGTANSTAIISGRVNEAMLFSGSVSYFYAYGFYQTAYAYINARPFSISLWINPTVYRSCAFAQIGYQLTNYACHNLIGLFSNSGVTMQVIAGSPSYYIYGSFIQINTWTHISMTYSSTNGIRLYINGVYFGSTGAFSYGNSGYIMWLELGYLNPCSTSVSMNAGYQGAIDEVYMHAREITASEVSVLANP